MVQMEEEAAGDTSDLLTKCQLNIYEHSKVTYDSWLPDDVTSDWQVKTDANKLLKTTTSAQPDDFSLTIIQSQPTGRITVPNFVKTGQFVAEIFRFFVFFSRWRPSTILDLFGELLANDKKAHSCVSLCHLSHQAWKSGEQSDLYVRCFKRGINKKYWLYFTYLFKSPPNERISIKLCTAIEVVDVITCDRGFRDQLKDGDSIGDR